MSDTSDKNNTDIADLLNQINSLRQDKTETEEKLSGLKEELRQAKEECLSVNRVKSLFVGKISHELRTPMNGVLGILELILEKKLDPELRSEIEMALFSAQSLLHLLDDLLNFSKLESGKLARRELAFDLFDFMKNFEILVSCSFSKRHSDINFLMALPKHENLRLLGDYNKLRQVLVNLTSNAFKFADKNGAVLLRMEIRERSESGVLLWFGVSDAGAGIPESEHERIFAPFEQVDDTFTRNTGGTGLGLAIASELVRLLEGDLSFESKVGVGTRFEISIPFKFAAAEQVELKNPETQQSPAAGLRMLVAEDNEMNQRLLGKILTNSGFVVSSAKDGMSALEATKNNQFDIILMDIQMPIMDGIDTLHHIRSDETNPNNETPVVAVTANALTEDKEKFLEFGMDGYITKPINRKQLIETISRLIAEKKLL